MKNSKRIARMYKVTVDEKTVGVRRSTVIKRLATWHENYGPPCRLEEITCARDLAIERLYGKNAFLFVNNEIQFDDYAWCGQICKPIPGSINTYNCITPRIFVKVEEPNNQENK